MDFNSDRKSFFKYIEQTGLNFHKREISVDNRLIELFFSNVDGLYSESDHQENFELQKRIEEIYYIIENMLPEIEKQVIILFFFLKKKQEIIGKVLKISQEMVCYYKNRALTRIKLLHIFRDIDINDMENFLGKHVTKKQKVAMIEYFKDHDLRRIAKKITAIENRKKQIKYEAIGSRIKLGLKKIKRLIQSKDKQTSEKSKLYCTVFGYLKKYNSLHHTQSKKQVSAEISA